MDGWLYRADLIQKKVEDFCDAEWGTLRLSLETRSNAKWSFAIDTGTNEQLYWKLILPIGRRIGLLQLVWAGAVIAVVVGSLLPADSSTIQTISELHVNDKVQHGLAYAVLALLPVVHERVRRAAVILVLMAAMGVLLEFGQLYSPGRSFDTHDMMADFAGLAAGAVIGRCLRPLVLRHVN